MGRGAGRAPLPAPPPTGGGETERGGCAGGRATRWIAAFICCPKGLPHLSQVVLRSSRNLRKLAIPGKSQCACGAAPCCLYYSQSIDVCVPARACGAACCFARAYSCARFMVCCVAMSWSAGCTSDGHTTAVCVLHVCVRSFCAYPSPFHVPCPTPMLHVVCVPSRPRMCCASLLCCGIVMHSVPVCGIQSLTHPFACRS